MRFGWMKPIAVLPGIPVHIRIVKLSPARRFPAQRFKPRYCVHQYRLQFDRRSRATKRNAGPERENWTASRSKNVRSSGSSTSTNGRQRHADSAPRAGRAFANLVLVSWLEDTGKDVIYVDAHQFRLNRLFGKLGR